MQWAFSSLDFRLPYTMSYTRQQRPRGPHRYIRDDESWGSRETKNPSNFRIDRKGITCISSIFSISAVGDRVTEPWDYGKYEVSIYSVETRTLEYNPFQIAMSSFPDCSTDWIKKPSHPLACITQKYPEDELLEWNTLRTSFDVLKIRLKTMRILLP